MNIPTRSPKTTYHHGNLKAALVSAALKELAQHGIEGISLRAVARRAGVSAPAVYRHFADKDALLTAVASECAERLGAAMQDAIAKAPAEPLERYRATGVALVRFAVANPEHFRALSIAGFGERANPELRAAQQAFIAADRASLAAAQAQGELADVPLDDLMLTAHVSIMGLARAIIDGRLGEVSERRAIQLATAVTHVLGEGFRPRRET